MEKRWEVKPKGNEKLVEELSLSLNINKVVANLLIQRGITTYDQAFHFFRPSTDDLHDPFLMKDMDKAVKRIEDAIENKERILIYGDYDVDGTTSVALLYSFFIERYSNIDFYIPDRYTEGYGISIKGIDYAAESNASLIIALDCGINANQKIDYASKLNIDFIICDHHLPGEIVPNACAILDPKQIDCLYPYKELSGCGVGFKLLQAYTSRNNIDFSHVLEHVDLVAISIASDIVEIKGENRVLAYYGLKKINSHPRPGVEAILEHGGYKRESNGTDDVSIFDREITINELVFSIGPRINAAGRIDDAKSSVKLLISKNFEEAKKIAFGVNESNNRRRDLDTETTKEALEMIEQSERMKTARTTVIYKENWKKGVLGIVAARLAEHYYRPTIVLTLVEGMLTGSARSVKGFDVYSAIDASSDLLESFGGHKYAAGLTIKKENIHEFIQRFEKIVADSIQDKQLIPEIEIDDFISLPDISPKFYHLIKQFAPFGPGNLSPVFATESVMEQGYARVVGENHIKLTVRPSETENYYYDAIAFQLKDKLEIVRGKLPFNICFSISENSWKGKTNLQLMIKDIKTC